MNIDTDKPQLPEMKGKERMEPPTSSDELYVKSHGSNQSSARKALVPSEAVAAERLGEGAREEAGRRCRMTNEPGGRPDEAKRQPKQMRSQADSNRETQSEVDALSFSRCLFPFPAHHTQGRGEGRCRYRREGGRAEQKKQQQPRGGGGEGGTVRAAAKGDHNDWRSSLQYSILVVVYIAAVCRRGGREERRRERVGGVKKKEQ